MPVVIQNVRPVPGEAVHAVYDADMSTGAILHHCLLKDLTGGGDFVALPPRVPLIDPTGVVRRDGAGRVIYRPAITFATPEVRAWFSRTVIAALRDQAPHAFDPGLR